ncbi:MAG: hypothetical protein RIS94_2900 [Pseudomonadota bacterium]
MNNNKPTWRKPVGILALMTGVAVYAVIVAGLSGPISGLPVLVQTPIYIVLGTIWLLPLKRFLIWMETGRWG